MFIVLFLLQTITEYKLIRYKKINQMPKISLGNRILTRTMNKL